MTYRLAAHLVASLRAKIVSQNLSAGARICFYTSRDELNILFIVAMSGLNLALCIGNPEQCAQGGLTLDLIVTDVKDAASASVRVLLIEPEWFQNKSAQLDNIRSGFRIASPTSGTTGRVKYIERSEQEYCGLLESISHYPRPEPRQSMVVTIGETAQWTLAERLGSLLLGHAQVYCERDYAALLHAIDLYKVGVVLTTPAYLDSLFKTQFQTDLLDSVSVLYIGGALVGEHILSKAKAVTRAKVVVQYGSTEAGYAAHLDYAPDDFEYGCVGAVEPVCEIRIVDADANRLAESEIGLVAIRNPRTLTTDHYAGASGTTSTQFKDGWFYPGDLGFIKQGRLFIAGRNTEIVNVGGNKIALNRIEGVLRASGCVDDVCALAITADNGSEDLCLAYVANNERSLETLTKALHDAKLLVSVSRAKLLSRLPVNASGKIDKASLRQFFQRG